MTATTQTTNNLTQDYRHIPGIPSRHASGKSRYLISAALTSGTNGMAYYVRQELEEACPGRAIVEADGYDFHIEKYAKEGLCQLTPKPGVFSQQKAEWDGATKPLRYEIRHGWYGVEWQGQTFELLLITWRDDGCDSRHIWLMADTTETAEAFLMEVLNWSAEVRGEVLVYSGGWHKDTDLYKAIQSSTFGNLILPGELKAEIQADFARFFASRELYERYNIPWKRGVLLIGPPGNGKTHAIKALVNQLGQPCLYVKSFKARHGTDHDNIREVFRRARRTTPCILVLEDLDSLIDDKNRAFFLNELDGFASNTGIIVVATTNHPEKLDSAILDRPSRFDRKYHFTLPAPDERRAYIERWNESLEADLRLEAETIAELVNLTDSFSFAYLKELFLSALMRWVSEPQTAFATALIETQSLLLREKETAPGAEHTPYPAVIPDPDDED